MREKQEQRKRFTRIIDTNDDEIMMKVFDNVQEEVRYISFKNSLVNFLFFLASFYFNKIITNPYRK